MKLKKYFELNKQDELSYGPEDDINFNEEEEEEAEEVDFEEVDPEDMNDEYDDDLTQDDVVESLLSTLRKMIRNSNFEKAYVFTDDERCINIQFILNQNEKIARIMKVVNFLKKLESDILIQYDSEFELWETKQGDPLFTAKFSYDENVSSIDDDEEEEEEAPF